MFRQRETHSFYNTSLQDIRLIYRESHLSYVVFPNHNFENLNCYLFMFAFLFFVFFHSSLHSFIACFLHYTAWDAGASLKLDIVMRSILKVLISLKHIHEINFCPQASS